MVTALLLIADAADENSAAYQAGRVFGIVVMIAIVLGVVFLIGKAVSGRRGGGSPGPPPGWFDDPEVAGGQRYWDGVKWTEYRRTAADDPGEPHTP